MQVHVSEADLVRDIESLMERVHQGAEIVIENGDRRIAVITPLERPGRPIDECIALARRIEKERGYAVIPDEDFADDVQAAVNAHREPLDPPEWD